MTVSMEGACSPYFKFTPTILVTVSRFNSPFTSSRIPFIVNPVFFNVHNAVDLSISISVCKEAATLLINNSPCCQKRIFLFSNSTPNEETPFVNASFRRKSTSSIRE